MPLTSFKLLCTTEEFEADFIIAQYKGFLPGAARSNVFAIFILLFAAFTYESRQPYAFIMMACNAVALCLHPFLPGTERRNGALKAHAVFVLWNTINASLGCGLLICLRVRSGLFADSSPLNQRSGFFPDSSPLVTAALCVNHCLLAAHLRVLLFPVQHRITLHAMMLAVVIVGFPDYTVLARATEAAFLHAGIMLGEYIGRFLVLTSYRSFCAAREGQQVIQTRLDQVLGEKERIQYDLAFALKQSSTSRRRKSRRKPTSSSDPHSDISSSYGTDMELVALNRMQYCGC